MSDTGAEATVAAIASAPAAGTAAGVSATGARWVAGLGVTACAGLLIAMGELDRLSGRVLDADGLSWPFGKLMGPSSWLITEAGWLSAPVERYAGALEVWLRWYLVLDAVFIGLYLGLGLWVLRMARGSGPAPWPWRAASFALWCVVVPDLIEDLLGFFTQRPLAPGWATTVWVVSRIKWIAVLVLVVALILMARATSGLSTGSPYRQAVWRAFYTQRFSLLFVTVVGLLSLTPGAEILDQLPDVERAWVDVGKSPELVAAAIAAAVSAILFFILGRLRSDFISSRVPKPGEPLAEPGKSNLAIWGGFPVFFLLFGWVGEALGWGPWLFDRFVWFGGAAFLIWAISLAIRWLDSPPKYAWWRARPHQLTPKGKRVADERIFRCTVLVGDVAAVAILAIGGLGIVRSFTAPVALAALVPGSENVYQVVALIAGAVLSIAVWPVLGWLIDHLPSQGRLAGLLTPGAQPSTPTWLRIACAAGFPLLLLLVANGPSWIGHVGIVAAACITLALVALTLGSAATLAQDRHPPELFWIPGLKVKSAPVFTLLVAVILLVSLSSPVAAVHSIRNEGEAASPVPDRPELTDAFDYWEGATKKCGKVETIDGVSYRVRTMPMLAAEGGGIRAAYWTSTGVDLLSGRSKFVAGTGRATTLSDGQVNRCRSALFAGGASGGAVGLTVSQFAGKVPGHQQVVGMARSTALAKATLGMLVRDVLYGASGAPLWSGAPGWQDRAGLIEEAWVADTGGDTSALANDFVPAALDQAAKTPTGYLILNSSSASTGCRVLVSQVKLPALSDTEGTVIRCDHGVDAEVPQVANSIDFFRYFGASSQAAGGGATTPAGCTGNLQTATAALLASRFPYVTPSGVVGPCGTGAADQLIDGGYIENSGIATITDLAPEWLRVVREHNTESLAAEGSDPVDLIVPMVVYFDNDTNSDLTVPPPGQTLEGLVPVMGYLRGNTSMNRATTLLQRAEAVVDASNLWTTGSPKANAALSAVRLVRPKGVIVVNQAVTPTVTAPLGWSMSGQSIESMNVALSNQLTTSCDHSPDLKEAEVGNSSLVCERGYGSLADAIAAIGG